MTVFERGGEPPQKPKIVIWVHFWVHSSSLKNERKSAFFEPQQQVLSGREGLVAMALGWSEGNYLPPRPMLLIPPSQMFGTQ